MPKSKAFFLQIGKDYIVKKVLSSGFLYLTNIEGKMTKMAINVDVVKIY